MLPRCSLSWTMRVRELKSSLLVRADGMLCIMRELDAIYSRLLTMCSSCKACAGWRSCGVGHHTGLLSRFQSVLCEGR